MTTYDEVIAIARKFRQLLPLWASATTMRMSKDFSLRLTAETGLFTPIETEMPKTFMGFDVVIDSVVPDDLVIMQAADGAVLGILKLESI